jgi:hypothetical protein
MDAKLDTAPDRGVGIDVSGNVKPRILGFFHHRSDLVAGTLDRMDRIVGRDTPQLAITLMKLAPSLIIVRHAARTLSTPSTIRPIDQTVLNTLHQSHIGAAKIAERRKAAQQRFGHHPSRPQRRK